MSNEDTSPDVLLVKEALASLRCCATAAGLYLERWFVPAFTWYRNMRLRGYEGAMAPVFDVGLRLVHSEVVPAVPPGELAGEQRDRFRHYAEFFAALGRSPLLAQARAAWEWSSPDRRLGVELRVIESVLRSFGQLWGGQPGGGEGAGNIPEFGRQPVVPADLPEVVPADPPWLSIRRAGLEPGRLKLALDPSGPLPPVPLPADGVNGEALPTPIAVFSACVAARAAGNVDRLDNAVVDTCLHGPNVRPARHEPPRRYSTVLEERTRSSLPGPIAGVTKVEIKTAEDSLIDVLPSELALLQANEEAGLARLLEGKVLVFRHERQQDLVPKHRALVVFVAEAGTSEESEESRGGGRPGAHRFPPYVYARRQVFDLVRDLREAHARLEDPSSVVIDVAVFLLTAYGEEAMVYRMFRVDRLSPRQSADDALDRLRQVTEFDGLVPRYFEIPFAAHLPRPVFEGDGAVHEIVDPHLDRFLQRQARRGDPYHAIYLVPVGSLDRVHDFVPVAAGHHRFGGARQRVMVIAVDPAEGDSDPRLPHEPAWWAGQSHSLTEAARLLGGSFLRPRPLAELRRDVVEMVIGEAKGRRGSARALRLG